MSVISLMHHPLFDHFPELREHLPVLPLLAEPSPVKAWQFDERKVWVKHDDACNGLYGGNKVRKLEFVLGQAIAQGKRKIVTIGATGTHHGLATAIFCQRHGLECEILLFEQPMTEHVKQNLIQLQKHGAKLRRCGTLARALLAYGLHPGRLRADTLLLFAGASNPVGVLAFVNAALELDAQITAAQLARPSAVYCGVGSAGTLAGLSLGMSLLQQPIPVLGVQVADSKLGPFSACTQSTVHQLMQQTVKYVRGLGVDWPKSVPQPHLDSAWLGAGYGQPTAEGQRALAVFEQTTGLPMDLTYTAKTFAAVLASEHATAPLYWHTLSSHLH